MTCASKCQTTTVPTQINSSCYSAFILILSCTVQNQDKQNQISTQISDDETLWVSSLKQSLWIITVIMLLEYDDRITSSLEFPLLPVKHQCQHCCTVEGGTHACTQTRLRIIKHLARTASYFHTVTAVFNLTFPSQAEQLLCCSCVVVQRNRNDW